MDTKVVKVKTFYGEILDVNELLRRCSDEEEELRYFDFIGGEGWLPVDQFMRTMECWAYVRAQRRRRE